jgi:hypothetical protein
MKNIALMIVLLIAVVGCDISKLANSATGNVTSSPTPSPTSESKPGPTASPKKESTPDKPGYIDTLKASKGKYPADIKLLDIADLNPKLKKLLGSDFAAMKRHWNVETPIEIENNIMMAGGCEAHNCGSNHYLLFVDLKSGNINVYHIEDSGTRHYWENGEIKLPAKFADELGPDR